VGLRFLVKSSQSSSKADEVNPVLLHLLFHSLDVLVVDGSKEFLLASFHERFTLSFDQDSHHHLEVVRKGGVEPPWLLTGGF
jgi:hypothetical protein